MKTIFPLPPPCKSTNSNKERYFFISNFTDDDVYCAFDSFAACKERFVPAMDAYVGSLVGRRCVARLLRRHHHFEIDSEDDLRRRDVAESNAPKPLVQMGFLQDANAVPMGYRLFPGNTNAAFAVWSDGDMQDDLRRYDARCLYDDSCGLVVPVAAHRSLGLYYADAWVGTKGGAVYLSTATARVSAPASASLDVYSEDRSNGWFAGKRSGLVSPSDASVAVGLAPTQRKSRWVGATVQSDGSWVFRLRRGAHALLRAPPATPTVRGEFTVGLRGYVFGSGYSCYYWTQFYGDYLFHSILYDQGTRNVQDGRLGMNLSHGCVRLAIENAKWIYDNIPSGTKVYVYS